MPIYILEKQTRPSKSEDRLAVDRFMALLAAILVTALFLFVPSDADAADRVEQIHTDEVGIVEPYADNSVQPTATQVAYLLLPVPARSWYSSGVADISGGRAQTPNMFIDSVFIEIQTYYGFPGFQIMYSTKAPTTGQAFMTHNVVENSMSRCQWGAPYGPEIGSTGLVCSYLK